MLIKSADDQSASIAALERLATGTGPDAKRASADLRKRKAGLKGEAQSAYLIDFEFAASRNWAVIHDLRLEHAGRVAQIDHLLINRWMDVYVLESKHFHAALRITDDGEFQQYNKYGRTWLGLPSPLMQNERHIAVLRDAMSAIELPMRMGMRISPTFHSLVLVAPSARIDRPKRFDASRVIKADHLKPRLWQDIDDEGLFVMVKTAAKLVSSETVEFVARQLASQHRPIKRRPATSTATVAAPVPPAPHSAGPACKACKQSDGDIHSGKYGYYFKCRACSANTAIRFACEPGHTPRLRKDKQAFYRDCQQCGTSILFHRIPGAA